MNSRIAVTTRRAGEDPVVYKVRDLKAALSYIEGLAAISRPDCFESFSIIHTIEPVSAFR